MKLLEWMGCFSSGNPSSKLKDIQTLLFKKVSKAWVEVVGQASRIPCYLEFMLQVQVHFQLLKFKFSHPSMFAEDLPCPQIILKLLRGMVALVHGF
jgi:hypothetical protein